MQEMQVRSPGQEDPLEKKRTTYSSILVWKIPWTEEAGRLQSMGLQQSQTRLSDSTTQQNFELFIVYDSKAPLLEFIKKKIYTFTFFKNLLSILINIENLYHMC